MYAAGQGVTQDFQEAAKWFRKAAEQGSEKAKILFADLLYQGKGVAQDYKEALTLFQWAAGKGNILSQFRLATMYVDGHGVSKDYAQAHKWLSLAVQGSNGNQELKEQLHRLEKVMTPEQIAEAQKLAREWQPTR